MSARPRVFNIPFRIFLLTMLLTGFGLIMVYSSSASYASYKRRTSIARHQGQEALTGDHRYHEPSFLVKQGVWLCLGLLGLFAAYHIDYRHLIASLVRKPGAFARYRYREAMFPTPVFRRTYDALCEALSERQADLNYLRILKLAAKTMQCEVETILEQLAADGDVPRFTVVESQQQPEPQSVPALTPLVADLASYDALLQSEEAQT